MIPPFRRSGQADTAAARQGAETVHMGAAEFCEFIRTETAKRQKVVKDAGIKAQ